MNQATIRKAMTIHCLWPSATAVHGVHRVKNYRQPPSPANSFVFGSNCMQISSILQCNSCLSARFSFLKPRSIAKCNSLVFVAIQISMPPFATHIPCRRSTSPPDNPTQPFRSIGVHAPL
ncbi:hypothetical protein BP00DRAFT_14071 [Aspergillus indologenus CBS 114.80]|uniref:Uncharacterized protein n=1 Tax=Aspergillus indologenus CBS 114.80 TaxID=1450541 RepID=A0A2V5IGM9_9EURO|nr:hypothetical protein BP00DRAFT_14071 [Aspergillus indologenus CBS 114.80]